MRRDNTLFKTLTYAVSIIGGILGILAGFIFSAKSLTQIIAKIIGEAAGARVEFSFNFIAMFTVWTTTAGVALTFWAIHCHLDNQASMISYLQKIHQTMQGKDKENENIDYLKNFLQNK